MSSPQDRQEGQEGCQDKGDPFGAGDVGAPQPAADRALAVPAEPVPVSSAVAASITGASVIGITGTQAGPTSRQKDTLVAVLVGFREGGVVWQHNGDCVGADRYAGLIWKALGGKVHLHPPSNSSKRAFIEADAEEPAKPYLERNGDIATASDVLVALPSGMTEELRSGTWSTVRRARKQMKPVIIVWPSGLWELDAPPIPRADAQAMPPHIEDSGIGFNASNDPFSQDSNRLGSEGSMLFHDTTFSRGGR
jgi:hypothetical protein